jgi:IS5 family transposase
LSVRISELERQLLKRRLAIEPIIGHLKGETGDRLHAVLCAAGYNIRWLLVEMNSSGPTK